jgi:holo-[acyl-carrier protein] synthase
MILGIGNDLVDIRRIESVLLRFGSRFEQRIFTTNEQKYAHKHEGADIKAIASIYAKRFAAKEACAKALATGMFEGVAWRDIEVIKKPSGAVGICLAGKALARLQELTPTGMKAQIFLSLSDEYPYAQAQTIISAEMN